MVANINIFKNNLFKDYYGIIYLKIVIAKDCDSVI